MSKNEKGFSLIIIALIVGFVAVGIVTGAVIIRTNQLKKQGVISQVSTTPSPKSSMATSSAEPCPSACQAIVEQKIADAKKEILKSLQNTSSNTPQTVIVNNPQPQPSTQPTTQSVSNQPQVLYLYFGVNGSTNSNSWVDLVGSDLSFNVANYPGAKSFIFQANLSSDAPDRTVYAQLINVGTGQSIPNSVISYTGLAATLIQSSSLSMPTGAITLRVQIHSMIGNLTTIQNPRLQINY
jgi:hypothetical protein